MPPQKLTSCKTVKRSGMMIAAGRDATDRVVGVIVSADQDHTTRPIKADSWCGNMENDLQEELIKAGFTIFETIQSYGFFTWKPRGPYTPLTSINTVRDIRRFVDLDGKPRELAPVDKMQLKLRSLSSPPPTQQIRSKFPYGENDLASLHVAVKCRGMKLDSIDFAFDGSTLEMLATQDTSASAPFFATLIPNTKIILVTLQKQFMQNYDNASYALQRLASGRNLSGFDSPPVESVEHMHVMKVSKYRVYFRARTVATKQGKPVEITESNPRKWGTSAMFRMIGSGSTMLCQTQGRGMLTRVDLKTLTDVSRVALFGRDVRKVERNIVSGMNALKAEAAKLEGRDVLQISFATGHLKLIPTSTKGSALLPSPDVVKKLLRHPRGDSESSFAQ